MICTLAVTTTTSPHPFLRGHSAVDVLYHRAQLISPSLSNRYVLPRPAPKPAVITDAAALRTQFFVAAFGLHVNGKFHGCITNHTARLP